MDWTMILKMSLAAGFYILVTWISCKLWNRGRKGISARILAGLVFGGCSVLSTHIGVDYGMMVLNVRDIGPLAAGLFIHPLSGIIAGLIGGIERYIASIAWHIGDYTQVACSVSTILAGLLPVFVHCKMQKGRRAPVFFSFFLGAVMEVFHMYAVFITHRDDIRTAYEVVKVCALPMIIFTGLGLAGCSLAVRFASGESNDPERRSAVKNSLPRQFQFWLMLGTALIFVINFIVSYSLQTQTAVESADYKLRDWSDDLQKSYQINSENSTRLILYMREEFLRDTGVIASAVEHSSSSLTEDRLKAICRISEFNGLALFGPDGRILMSTGDAFPLPENLIPFYEHVSLDDLLAGKDSRTILTSADNFYAFVRCGENYLCSAEGITDRWSKLDFMDITSILNDYQFPEEAYYLITMDLNDSLYPYTGTLMPEDTEMKPLPQETAALLLSHKDEGSFYSSILGVTGFCMFRTVDQEAGCCSLVVYPSFYAFEERDAQLYESGFSDILLFIGLYLIVNALMNRMVVNPLSSVNASLRKITSGELNEVVRVRTATEFSQLSDDINTTVTALKGYIHAAEKRMEQELALARTIQDSALPRNFTFPRKDFELFATMDPAKEVGGDFYDFFFTTTDKLCLVIADVSGKGIPGALFMMQAKAAIRNQALTGVSPAEIFMKANHVLCEGNDAEMFVTAWIGVLDLATGKMICANAGHEYPVLCRAGGEYELYKDKHTLPLAAVDGVPMKEYELDLFPGDRLFVYTDGVPEAVNPANEAYGTDRLIAALNRVKTRTQQETLTAVREDLSAFVGEADQFDDITMLGFDYRGPQQK